MTAKTAAMVSAILGSSIVFLDSSVVLVALPRIGQELPTTLFGTLEGQSYVFSGYLLTLSALLVLAGGLNDFYGRKRAFGWGLVGFGLTSVACGLAPNMEVLVLTRVLQGATGALLVPGSLALINAAFEGEERGRAFGYWSGASAATSILGPFVGGLLVDSVSWRMVFFINVPIVIGALWVLRRAAESRDPRATGEFDWFGSFLLAVAVGGLSFGTIYGQQREWREPLAYAFLAAGAAALLAAPLWMTRCRAPLIPPDLFRSRNFNVTNLSTFLIYGALYVILYFFTLFVQGVIGYTAAAAGIASMPAALLLVFGSSRAGALAGRYGPRVFMAVGPLIMAAGVLLLALVPADSDAWMLGADAGSFAPPVDYLTQMLPGLVIFGIGLTVMVAPLVTALMNSVPVESSGVASAINNAISRVGPQLMGALLFVAVTASFYSGMERRLPGLDVSAPEVRQLVAPLNPPQLRTGERPPAEPALIERASRESSTEAFHLAMFVAAALLLSGAVVNAVGIRNAPQPSS